MGGRVNSDLFRREAVGEWGGSSGASGGAALALCRRVCMYFTRTWVTRNGVEALEAFEALGSARGKRRELVERKAWGLLGPLWVLWILGALRVPGSRWEKLRAAHSELPSFEINPVIRAISCRGVRTKAWKGFGKKGWRVGGNAKGIYHCYVVVTSPHYHRL